jgi:hypothetical protein
VDRVRFITHREQRILLVDCTDCTPDEVAGIADRLPEIVTQEPLGSLLALGDFTRAQFTREAVEHLKIAAAFHRAHLKRSAWVLTENLPKALYDSICSFSAREIPTFATRDEALDYLVSGILSRSD